MKIAIHQPNFLPWAGYFHKMAQVDRFVFLDNAQLVQHEYDNRNKVKLPNGTAQWASVHLPRKMPSFLPLNEVALAHDNWRAKLGNLLFECYHRAPHYEPLMGQLMSVVDGKYGSLAELNLALLTLVCKELGIVTQTCKASDYDGDMGHKNEQLINICLEEKADTYLTGKGSIGYLEPEMFKEAGIEIEFQNYEPIIYPQIHGEFLSNLSVIDLLFNTGPQARDFLLGG